MVTQDPMTSLNPLKTIGKQIEECVILHQKLQGKEAYQRTLQLLKDVGIHDVEKGISNIPMNFREECVNVLSLRSPLLVIRKY